MCWSPRCLWTCTRHTSPVQKLCYQGPTRSWPRIQECLLDVMEPKVLEDVYKTHLTGGARFHLNLGFTMKCLQMGMFCNSLQLADSNSQSDSISHPRRFRT
jgi:hypothetical protein